MNRMTGEKIIYGSRLIRALGYGGITIWPFVFIAAKKEECPAWIIEHERVHLRQQVSWFILPFFLVYCWDYVVGRLRGMNHDTAYRNIRFEVEAYGIAGSENNNLRREP